MKEAFQFDVDGQCDQIGRFFKVLGNKFAHKISPKRLVTFGAIPKQIIVLFLLFWQPLETFGLPLNSNIWSHWQNYLKHGPTRTLFVYFHPFHNAYKYKYSTFFTINEKTYIVCLGLEPVAA